MFLWKSLVFAILDYGCHLVNFLGMPVSVIGDSIGTNPGPEVTRVAGQIELDLVKCDCCGLTEECTLSYIPAIRERYINNCKIELV